MAAANTDCTSRYSRWKTAVVGPLPQDFLRINSVQNESQNQMTCQSFYPNYSYVVPNSIPRLNITCAQAKLNRNYGLTRMDPYCRIRVGHYIYETQTDPNGGKTPHWNRVIQTQLPPGVTSIYVEIYDECSFKMDELIAWCEIKIPEKVIKGKTLEEWYPLSGKQGENLEGTIDIVLSYADQPIQPYMYQTIPTQPISYSSGGRMPVFVTQQPSIIVNNPVPNSENFSYKDMKQIEEMFPNIEKEVIKSVFEANRGKKNETINTLLQMNS